MTTKKERTPKPKPTNVICNVCELAWTRHGENPTLDTCIGLLKADLAKANRNSYAAQFFATGQTVR